MNDYCKNSVHTKTNFTNEVVDDVITKDNFIGVDQRKDDTGMMKPSEKVKTKRK